MQTKTFLMLSLGLTGLIGAAHSAGADPFLPVPPASFLNYHVGSADQLAQEVALDAVVRARLANHFHQSPVQVTRYIQDNLVLTHLAKPGMYRVACITPSGREYFLNQHLAAGTGVFALKSTGQPILKQACGNPLVAVLPAVAPRKVAPPQLAASPKTLPAKAAVAATLPSDVVFTATPPLEAAQTGGLGPFVKVAGITQSLGHSGGGGFFPAVLGVAGLGLFAGHHGTASSSSTSSIPLGPVPSTPTTPTTPIVPSTPTTPTTPIVPSTPTTPTTPIVPTTPTTPTIPTTPPVLTPPTVTPPFIGPPPTVPPSQTAVPEPGPIAIFGLGAAALGLLCLRARRRASN